MACSKNTEKESLSGRDVELLLHALKCLKSGIKLDIDHEKFAELAGLKNKSVATVVWGRVKRKLDRMSSDLSTDTEIFPNPSKASKGRKRKMTDDAGSPPAKASKKGCDEYSGLKPAPQDIGIKPEPTSDGEDVIGARDSDDDQL